jgi:menaquinone-specific isochorismate synthase
VKNPFTLGLANLWHLASDIQGVMKNEANVLSVIDLIHPTAAVAGVPTDLALKLINEIEAVPRGRFAGPVGWVDGAWNGEWAIALRCASFDGDEIVAHAGAGILKDSKPESEFAETELKLMPVRTALQNS